MDVHWRYISYHILACFYMISRLRTSEAKSQFSKVILNSIKNDNNFVVNTSVNQFHCVCIKIIHLSFRLIIIHTKTIHVIFSDGSTTCSCYITWLQRFLGVYIVNVYKCTHQIFNLILTKTHDLSDFMCCSGRWKFYFIFSWPFMKYTKRL